MKRGLWILAAALLAGLAGFAITHWQCCEFLTGKTASAHGSSRMPELEWLRREFKLTEAQFAKVSELHLAYRPTCESLCMKVMTSHDRVKKLVGSGIEISPELKAALNDHAQLHVECQTAMLKHLYQTAACLSPEQARRYLDALLPQVLEMSMEPETTPRGH
ncbi:MAG: hypothetical protein RL693_1968 [Verrucomicrobiota bacterium]|jgi:Spy/CpxP family protein refolding chaperone